MRPEPTPKALPTPSVKAANVYHHGDLRAALILAAREALETMPPDAVTLKSLAARLRVSQPAPYRHFDSREALLAAVAADGFERFRAQLIEAEAGATSTQKFEACCLAYVTFGRANLGVYRLMFASRLLPASDDRSLKAAAGAAFDLLVEGVSQYVAAERAHAAAIWVWSTLHGMVMLDAEGLLSGPREARVEPIEIIRQTVAGLATGKAQ